jgi:hypothetical protein
MEVDQEKEKKKTKKDKKKKKEKANNDSDMEEENDQVGDLPEPTVTDDDEMTGKEIWNDQNVPLGDDEEMDFDSAAYEMLHRSKVEWPCLSVDIIVRERSGGPTGIFN